MRGRKKMQTSMLSLSSTEGLVPKRHPLRKLKPIADEALERLEGTFEAMYAQSGRQSIPPETLLKSMLLIALYSVRSERLFCEQLGYNMLFKWFLDLEIADPAFDQSTFSKNRARLMEHDVAGEFFASVVASAKKRRLLSSEHFSVDGTLIESYASMKSFRPKDDDDNDSNGWSDFRGEPRGNSTHESKTDPDARLARKGRGRESKLAFVANALMENRNGLLVGFQIDLATGTAEREGALDLLDGSLPGNRYVTLGADRGYDTRDFVAECRERNVVPHVAQNVSGRRSAIDERTTRHPGYEISQVVRRRIEQVFGWMKGTAGFRKSRYRGRERTDFFAKFVATSYNLLRIARLSDQPT